MWWITGFVALCAVIAVVMARRGPGNGADHASNPARHDPVGSGYHPGGGFGDGGV